MIQLRYLLVALLALAITACASHRQPKSRAKIYSNDEGPGIRMLDEPEKPGGPVGQ